MLPFIKMMIKHHIRRSYLIILGIACSVTMMFCMIQMGDSINNKYREQAVGANRYDFHITGLTKEQAELLKGEFGQEEIEASGILYSDHCELQMRPEALQKMEFQLCAGTKEGLEETGLRLSDGAWGEAPDEIVLEEYVCELLGKQIGDEITVVCDSTGESWCFRLSGIMENTPVLSSSDWTRGFLCVSFALLFDAGLTAPETEEYNLVITVNSDIDTYDMKEIAGWSMTTRELLGQIYGIDYNAILQKFRNGEPISSQEDILIKKINANIQNNSSKEENVLEYELQSSAGNALKAFSFLLAVTMVLLIFNSMHLAIAENTRELGMLRCIGMNGRQTCLIVFSENIVYCILGYGIGIAFGNLLNQAATKNVLLFLTGEPVKIRQLFGSYLLTAEVVLVSLVMAFVLCVHKILALTPIEASKYIGVAAPTPGVHTMEKWSAVKFAGRNIRRERGKSMIVMLSMIFSMMILMLIINTIRSVKMPDKDPKSQFSDYEAYVSRTGIIDAMEGISAAEISDSEMSELWKVSGVEEVYVIGLNTDSEKAMSLQSGAPVSVAIYNDALLQWLLGQNGKTQLWEEGPESICVIAGTYGEEEQKMLDEIEETGAVAYRLDNGKEGVLNVDYILHTNYMPENRGAAGGPVTVILTEKAAFEIYGDYSYTDMMIKCNSDADEGTYTEIAGIFADNEYVVFGSYEIGMEKMITDMLVIVYIGAMIVAATAITAVLNMMIIMRANLILRRKEHGIWRALGMPLKTLKRTISMEVLLMLFISYAAAVVLSIPFQQYMCELMENFNIERIVTGYLGVGIVSILLVYLLVMSGLKFRDTNRIIADIREN